MRTLDLIRDLFRRKGSSEYGGESVTQLEHALQCAQLAERAGLDSATIAAALLHDVGHLLHELPDDAPDQGLDDRHEDLGELWLRERFGPEVTEPVRLHVDAKRYLCAVDEGYRARLSPPSVQSLELQGGPMRPAEVAAFEKLPFHAVAVTVRRFDDEAKVVGHATPDLEHYLEHVARVVRSERGADA